MSQPFHELQATGAEINAVAEQIMPILDGQPEHVAVAALLTLVAIIQCPEIDQDDLAKAVTGMSQWFCFNLADNPKYTNVTDTPTIN